jgi:hypothetical protein
MRGAYNQPLKLYNNIPNPPFGDEIGYLERYTESTITPHLGSFGTPIYPTRTSQSSTKDFSASVSSHVQAPPSIPTPTVSGGRPHISGSRRRPDLVFGSVTAENVETADLRAHSPVSSVSTAFTPRLSTPLPITSSGIKEPNKMLNGHGSLVDSDEGNQSSVSVMPLIFVTTTCSSV